MSAFVKLRLDDGRDSVFCIDDIGGIEEPRQEDATAESKTGCVRLFDRAGIEEAWVIGTVDSVLAAIRDAEKEGTK